MAELSDARREELRRDLSARAAAFAPDWTDWTESDPGITLVELFAFLAEDLPSRADLTPKARTRLREVIDRLERAINADCQDGTLTRNRYFTGKFLSPDDFEQEQSYHRTKHRRHNRLLHGVGIVRGLGVGLEQRPGGGHPGIVVSPGLAIDSSGEELVVCEPANLDPCQSSRVCYVTVALVERPTNPTPDGEASRIEESAEVAVSEDLPAGHLAIARLRNEDGVWRSDSSFSAPRVR